jgi:hypothetical protein
MKCPRDVNNPLSNIFLTPLITLGPKFKIKKGQILFSLLVGVRPVFLTFNYL